MAIALSCHAFPPHRGLYVSSQDPLHGMTLAKILEELVAKYGWDGLAKRIDIRCFKSDPSIKSSLTFLRKTPWAREKVESLFIDVRRRQE
nr:VF530 family protein [Pseudomonas tohonis]